MSGAGVALPAEARETLTPTATLGLLLSTALVPLGSTMIAVALPAMGRDFGADPASLTQWLVNSYLVVGIVLQSPAGKLGDRWGARRALTLGQALFAVGALLGFLGGSLALLVASRVLMAAGGALMMPATMAVLRRSTSVERRARVFGAFGASMGLAAALGPLVGGVLVGAFGWRSIFLVNVPILMAAAPLIRGVSGDSPRGGVAFDWGGSVLLALGLSVAVAGSKTEGATAATLLGLGGLLLFAFLRWEQRVEDPVLDPALFRRSAFAAGGALIALHNWVMYALIFQLPIWFGTVMGTGPVEMGRVLIAMMLSMVVCSPLGGRASERYGARALAVAGTLSMLAGFLLLVLLQPLATASQAVPALILIGAGLGLAAAPAQSSAISAIPREQSGMAAGAISTMRYVGGIVGIGALGLLLRDAGAGADEAAAAAQVRVLWLSCAVALLAIVPAAGLPGRGAGEGAQETLELRRDPHRSAR
jgi:MFS family permease